MTDKDTGGRAFPLAGHKYCNACSGDIELGMTLRDWFAGMALQGFIVAAVSLNRGAIDVEYAAESSYQAADLMIEARKR